MEPLALIRHLGGPTRVSHRLGKTPQTIHNWGVRGRIPGEFLLPLWEMAIEAGVDWQPDGADKLRQMLTNPPPPTSVAA